MANRNVYQIKSNQFQIQTNANETKKAHTKQTKNDKRIRAQSTRMDGAPICWNRLDTKMNKNREKSVCVYKTTTSTKTAFGCAHAIH